MGDHHVICGFVVSYWRDNLDPKVTLSAYKQNKKIGSCLNIQDSQPEIGSEQTVQLAMGHHGDEQTSGGFVDAPGTNINLGGDNSPEMPMSILTAPR